MTLIQQNRYDQLLRRVGDLKGGGSKVNDVLSELFPMIDVENVPGELLLLMQTNICMGGGTLAAGVAVAPKASLDNPVGSGKLITLTKVYLSTTAAGVIRWGVSNVSIATPISTQVFRDTRQFAAGLPTGQVHELAEAALAPGTNQVRVLANSPLVLEDENGVAVLSPGTNFQIGHGTTNTSIFYGFNWRERVAQPSELNL